MGWLFSYQSLADQKKEIIEHYSREKRLIGHKTTSYGCRFWLAVENQQGEKYILLYLFERGRDGMWGYKDMDESMHPYFFDCPQSLFALCPTSEERALRWRETCRAYQAKRKAA